MGRENVLGLIAIALGVVGILLLIASLIALCTFHPILAIALFILSLFFLGLALFVGFLWFLKVIVLS